MRRTLPSRRGRPIHWLGGLLLALLLGSASPAARAVPPPAAERAPAVVAAAPLASWLDTISGPFESVLNSRQRMFQFCCAGMALGLFIIWYRKP